MGRRNKKSSRIVYSTNPDYNFEESEEQDMVTLPIKEQDLRVSLDKKSRGGKKVTLIMGFQGSQDDLKELGKLVKTKCGVGGSVKDQQILIQGDLVNKVIGILQDEGYPVKRSGG